MLTDTTGSPYAKVHLDGMKVKWTGGLEGTTTCANSTVPQLKHMFDKRYQSTVRSCTELFSETETFINGWSLPSILLIRQIL